MNGKPDAHNGTGVNRRRFMGALGVAASAALLHGERTPRSSDSVPYLNSFGDVVPAAADAVAAGVLPPPVTLGDGTYLEPGYTQPNILLIMVDQLRAPRWLPPGGQPAIDAILPNIAAIRNHSFIFSNYFAAATNCTPSRATLLTGLYSQQTCVFETQLAGNVPSLQTDFPTFAQPLSQWGYDTAWIGKWHVSDFDQHGVGGNGPSDYGFTNPYCLPTSTSVFTDPKGYPSPIGIHNQGNGGHFLDRSYPHYGITFPGGEHAPEGWIQLNDAAITDAFVNYWLPNAPASPWFTAVSFVNPHDISAFPYSYALTPAAGQPCGDFCPPAHPKGDGYQPPPTAGYIETRPDHIDIPPLSACSPYTAPPSPWNDADNPALQPYGRGRGKPGLQADFQYTYDSTHGAIQDTNGWVTFLNYYFWMQACVDHQIGVVINTFQKTSSWSNTIILFLADHGDYGGSHWMHAKGGALYDEVINVPLYISFPSMRANYSQPGDNTSITRSFVCSSVDIFGFFYSLALGNDSWRWNSSDPVNYLKNRESLADGIWWSAPQQRRLSSVPNANGTGHQPYILHTQDEMAAAKIPATNTPQPSHALAFRTVDVTTTPAGGAKLGIYSYWQPCTTCPYVGDTHRQQQYEFYNYSAGNYAETGNQAFGVDDQLSPDAQRYLNSFNAAVYNELYPIYPQVQAAYQAAFSTYMTYRKESCSGTAGCQAT
jgi:arylsulfatase A-like enzyme